MHYSIVYKNRQQKIKNTYNIVWPCLFPKVENIGHFNYKTKIESFTCLHYMPISKGAILIYLDLNNFPECGILIEDLFRFSCLSHDNKIDRISFA